MGEGDIDCSMNEELNDDEQIIAAVMQQPDEAVDEEDEGNEPATNISYGEAKAMEKKTCLLYGYCLLYGFQ